MSPLSELQAGLQRAIRIGDGRVAAATIASQSLAPEQRLQIYRNHHRITLAAALAATYPVTRQLVGERCFAGLVREFIVLSPPTSPCLFEYGEGFARYLAAVPILMELPYLADLARLEWAVNAARHAADAARLPASALAPLLDGCFSEIEFTLHPSCRLLTSWYSVDGLWRAHQAGDWSGAEASRRRERLCLLVYRDSEDDAGWCQLSQGEFEFVRSLGNAVSLGRAWDRATETEPSFDGSRTLSGLFDAGIFSNYRFPTTSNSR